MLTLRANPWNEHPLRIRKPRDASFGFHTQIALHVDAWGIGLGVGLDIAFGERVDDGGFEAGHQLPYRELAAAHIHQHVEHQLARAVIGHLAAAITLHHRDVAGASRCSALPA